MLMEFILRLLNFDLLWFFHLVMDNLFWVFGFFALGYIIADKDFKRGFGLAIFMFYFYGLSLAELQVISGFVYTTAYYLMFVYIGRLSMAMLSETTPSLKRHFTTMVIGISFLIYFAYNWFWVGA